MKMGGRYLHEIFEARVREAPDRIAVCTPQTSITYGQLDARANLLAQRLRRAGIGPEAMVGLCVDPTIDMVVGILGILKAGGAYVPIDPEYPARRICFLLEDTGLSTVVTVGRVAKSLEGQNVAVVCIDQNEAATTPVFDRQKSSKTQSELAYVIYTSGSSGRPKGVMIEHVNVVRLFEQTSHWFHFDASDVWCLFHSISFDFSVWEIWGALLYGGRLVIVPTDVRRSPGQLLSLLRTQGVTILNQTPSAFRQLVATDLINTTASDFSLRLVIFGGERLDVEMLTPWIAQYGDERPALINMYGVTETTVHVTYKRISSANLEHPEVSPIGVPIPDLQIHLLDSSGQPVPCGTPGEVHIVGPGLARGYLNRPEMTAERFVVKELTGAEGETRMYRSGDLAVRMPGGELAYLGRLDDQIKVRGFRVEPREVEMCLLNHGGVENIIVTAHDYGDDDVRLIAYVVPLTGFELTDQLCEKLVAELVERANTELPSHLRPTSYRVTSEIPITAHGKVDRDALRSLNGKRPPSKNLSEPLTETELVIMKISEEVLQRKGISTQDDLFDLGATSLAFTRILVQLNQQLNVFLTGGELDSAATVAALAACADQQQGNHSPRELAQEN